MHLFVKFEPIFCKKSEPVLQNEPVRILYPFHQLLSKNTAEKDTFSAVFFYPSRRLGISSPLGVYHQPFGLYIITEGAYHQP